MSLIKKTYFNTYPYKALCEVQKEFFRNYGCPGRYTIAGTELHVVDAPSLNYKGGTVDVDDVTNLDFKPLVGVSFFGEDHCSIEVFYRVDEGIEVAAEELTQLYNNKHRFFGGHTISKEQLERFIIMKDLEFNNDYVLEEQIEDYLQENRF